MSAGNARPTARKPAEQPGSGGIQVIARIAEILRTLGAAPGGMTQAELCEQIGLARSTVHRLLSAMRDEGLVETSGPRGRYRLGPAIRRMADAAWRSGLGGLDTIGVRGNLASAYHSAGRMASALELYERTRADCQRVLGTDHPDTLAARANLAHAYYAMGRLTEAGALLRSTLADCEQVLAPGDPLTAAVRDSLEAVTRA